MHQVVRIKMPLSSLPSARAAQDRCGVKGDLPMRPPLRGPWNGETRFTPMQTRFACSRGAADPNGPRPQPRDSILRPTWDPGSPPWRRVMGEGFVSHVWSLLLCRSKSNPHGQLEWSKRVKTHFRLCSQIGVSGPRPHLGPCGFRPRGWHNPRYLHLLTLPPRVP